MAEEIIGGEEWGNMYAVRATGVHSCPCCFIICLFVSGSLRHYVRVAVVLTLSVRYASEPEAICFTN